MQKWPQITILVFFRSFFRIFGAQAGEGDLVFFSQFFATQETIYRSLRALRARNPKKVSKRVFLGVCKKVPENTRKIRKIPQKIPKFGFFGYFSTFSGIFGDFFADPPKDSFRDFFGISGPEGPETPVNGRLGRNSFSYFRDSGGFVICTRPAGKRQFVHKMFVHNFCAPKPPPPNQQSDGFPLDFLLKDLK